MNDNMPKKRMTGEERKTQIIKNTIDLVSEKGFKSITIRDIAKRSQINEALIFQHFKSKEELLTEVVKEVIYKRAKFIGKIEIPLTEQEFIDKLNLYEKFFLTLNIENPIYLKIILYCILENYSIPDEENMTNDEAFLQWLNDSVEKGKKEWGFNKNINTEIAVSVFNGSLVYFILRNLIMNKTNINLQEIEHKFVQTFINSLK